MAAAGGGKEERRISERVGFDSDLIRIRLGSDALVDLKPRFACRFNMEDLGALIMMLFRDVVMQMSRGEGSFHPELIGAPNRNFD